MATPCRHVPMIPNSCPVCAVYAFYPHMKAVYDRQHPDTEELKKAVGDDIKPKSSCFHRGKVKKRADCNCPFKFVHECEVHGECTIGPNKDGVRSCFGCSDYSIE